jgi:hypothetical protein
MKARHHERLATTAILSAILAAMVSCSVAAPAAADELAYLMYLKGTEGKVAPFHVLWSEVDDANGRITIDLGKPYETWLKKIGLGRVAAYEAKLHGRDFVVRDPQFTRFVKVVADDLVRGPQETSLAPGVTPLPLGANVAGAVLLITPAPDKAQLEVIARLSVTYLAPQKDAEPVERELINGDLLFVGQRDPKGVDRKSR